MMYSTGTLAKAGGGKGRETKQRIARRGARARTLEAGVTGGTSRRRETGEFGVGSSDGGASSVILIGEAGGC